MWKKDSELKMNRLGPYHALNKYDPNMNLQSVDSDNWKSMEFATKVLEV